jgi:hypothetical protein
MANETAATFRIFQIGFPKIMQSDNGTEFALNSTVKKMNELFNIEHRTLLRNLRANGLAERWYRRQ